MDNQVFYRKWRPFDFDNVVGQNHITSTLKRAILLERIAHAYLFTGPRGVGKTSTARILAKALNSEINDDGNPVIESETSLAIDEGRYLDLVEIDAASNRRIDDVRELLDSVQIQPTLGKYKIYIIDEVHMLTPEAFNALLKTLEEPPPNIVFILATTDSHKIPDTIKSRCQRFDFRRLSDDDVIDRLIEICDSENIETEQEVLEIIARISWGSLRDAESLLEQLHISYGGNNNEIKEDQAREFLGLGDFEICLNLAFCIINKKSSEALKLINSEYNKGTNLNSIYQGLLETLRSSLLIKAGILEQENLEKYSDEFRSSISKISLEKILEILTIFSKIKIDESEKLLNFEIAIIDSIVGKQTVYESKAQHLTTDNKPEQTNAQNKILTEDGVQEKYVNNSSDSKVNNFRKEKSKDEIKWDDVIYQTRRTKNKQFNISALLRNVETPIVTDNKIKLKFKSNAIKKHFMDEMEDPRSKNALKLAINKSYGSELDLQISSPKEENNKTDHAQQKETSSSIKKALSMGAKIINNETSEDINE